MGRTKMQIPPTRSMSRAITVAKIGRLMKKLTMIRLALEGLARRLWWMSGRQPGQVVDYDLGFAGAGLLAPASPFLTAPSEPVAPDFVVAPEDLTADASGPGAAVADGFGGVGARACAGRV